VAGAIGRLGRWCESRELRGWDKERKEALLFVNKKKQKNFIRFSAGLFQRRAKRSKKVFWFFFSKKNFLLLFTSLFESTSP
jgi:hypothetical protein